MKIAEITRGTAKQMRRRAQCDAKDLYQDLHRWFPLECWDVDWQEPEGPYDGYSILVRYCGEVGRVQEKGKWKAKMRPERRARHTP